MNDGNIFFLTLSMAAFLVFGAALVYADWTATHPRN
jgi:hypothetical protein